MKNLQAKIEFDPSQQFIGEILTVPVDEIISTHNFRIDLTNLEELMDSIKEHGILYPLIAMKSGSKYDLIGGHRRLACAKLLKISHVQIKVIENPIESKKLVSLIDNLCRENLSGWEVCKAIHDLSKNYKTQIALAQAIHKSQTYISLALKAYNRYENTSVMDDNQMSIRDIFELLSDSKKLGTGNPFQSIVYSPSKKNSDWKLKIDYKVVELEKEEKKFILKTLYDLAEKIEEELK